MKRELKFRAWDGKNMFISPSSFEPLHHLGSWFEAHSAFRYTPKESDDAIIMQFTGLLDKNGKEIYEGDIVRFLDENYQVIYFEPYAAFMLQHSNGNDLKNIYTSEEVIGNIYENPDLLQ